VFAQQVGALLQNRADQATIERQVEHLRLDRSGSTWPWKVARRDSGLGPRQRPALFLDRWKAMLGYRPEEVGKTSGSGRAGASDDLAQSQELVAAHLSGTTEVYQNTHRLRHKNGHYVWIMALGKLLRDGEGAARAWSASTST